MNKNRKYYADIIVKRLQDSNELITNQIQNETDNNSSFVYFYVDDLLPKDDALEIHSKFPESSGMKIKKSLREYKFVEAQLNEHDKILEEITYAFQEKEVIDTFSNILNKYDMEADEFLYAGGLSKMDKGHYLNPHLDNSHDKDRSLYRVLNLLYYVSPNRTIEDGGNLELWPAGLKKDRIVIHSKFNRLVLMVTNKKSFHAVSEVVNGDRCCVSNYYFSKTPFEKKDYFQVTSFRGFPNQKIRDKVLLLDSVLRMSIRKLFPKGIIENKHVYKKQM